MAERSSENLVGRQLGDYKLVALIAEGGMAKIYRAVDVELEREVAVKVLTSAMVDADSTLAERFQREARAVAKLEHENIIPVYRAGKQEGYYYLAMKLITGKDLADELYELKQQYKLMNPRRMLHIMEQTAAALDYAHAAGIVHRDVKPSNILIDETGRAVLSDFGLVLRMQVDKTMGTAFGTPRYISPEQALASEKAVPASDIYSLAVIIYEILTGQMLFEAENAMQIALSHISETPRLPTELNPDIPKAVEREVMRALEKDPSKRHVTAGEFISSLRAAYGDALPSPRDIAPELAQSHTPVLDAPPDFERIAAEQRKGSIVEAPQPITRPEPVKEIGTTAQKTAPETFLKARPSRSRFRLFLLNMIAVMAAMVVILTKVGDEAGIKTPPTLWAEIFGRATTTPVALIGQVSPTGTETATYTAAALTATDTVSPTVAETVSATATASSTEAITPSPTVAKTGEPTAVDTEAPTTTEEVTATEETTAMEEVIGTEEATATRTQSPTRTSTRAPSSTPSSAPTEPTPTSPVIIPGQGEPVTLLYNSDALVIRNDSETATILIETLGIAHDDGVLHFSGRDPNPRSIPPGGCVVIISQRPGSELPSAWSCPADCDQTHIPDNSIFWRRTASSENFRILVDAETVAECPAVRRGGEETCTLNWPIWEEGASD